MELNIVGIVWVGYEVCGNGGGVAMNHENLQNRRSNNARNTCYNFSFMFETICIHIRPNSVNCLLYTVFCYRDHCASST